MLGLACGAEAPTAPPPPIIIEPPPPTPPRQLPSGEPVATYVFSARLDYAVSGATSASRYVLWDGGVFGLRYDAFSNTAVYLGTYRQDNGTITFRFDGQWSLGGLATGTLKGDLLEVRYSLGMQLSDFEDALYRRSQ